MSRIVHVAFEWSVVCTRGGMLCRQGGGLMDRPRSLREKCGVCTRGGIYKWVS